MGFDIFSRRDGAPSGRLLACMPDRILVQTFAVVGIEESFKFLLEEHSDDFKLPSPMTTTFESRRKHWYNNKSCGRRAVVRAFSLTTFGHWLFWYGTFMVGPFVWFGSRNVLMRVKLV